ncbi:MAG: urease accessory protein UreF [Pseudomonadota bacterium]
MDEGLYKLTSWLSPAYPVGAYTYSHGLEWAIHAGDVGDATTAESWIAACLEHGAGRSDAILLVHAHAAASAGEPTYLREISELASALAPSPERLLETEAQGAAFSTITQTAWGADAWARLPYPVALGAAAAQHGIPAKETVELFLHAFASNLVSACVRLVPLGQSEGQKIIAHLMPLVETVSGAALTSDLDDLGGIAIRADIASMKHETQDVRLFRS